MRSPWLRDAGVAACAALALAAAFPKFGAAWLVPFGTAALFWTWQGSSWKRAAVLGWFAGAIFFTIGFSWIGHTVGSYIGIFGPVLPFAGAMIEAPFFAMAAVLASYAYRHVRAAFAPLAAAAAFTACEWIRTIGVLGVPFDQLGYSQADTPLRAIAAYSGTAGITFVLCVIGAYFADAAIRRTWKPLAATIAAVVVATSFAWWAWPARSVPRPTIPVAAIQGNIAQSLKWNSLDMAVTRYIGMTHKALLHHPKLIVWPETVIPTILNTDPYLTQAVRTLAVGWKSTLVAGSQSSHGPNVYNSLYIFAPSGAYSLYDKRQLVPFAESFPGRSFLSWLPYIARLSGQFGNGRIDGVYQTQALPIAPLICWESGFSDLAFAQIRRGAQLLVVSTDDAWFGTTSGPYMHAQIAQLRAIESGAYVVRAAATGISGIIDPDGSWQARSKMEERVIIYGKVGKRVDTVFSHVGPTPIGAAAFLLYALLIVLPDSRRRR
ncbi:MAG TPA: apolipoprotein N-acyltransferase, partial [Candidatus Tumulicola sp.]